ncbi:MAG: hypothetical protein HQK50_09870 [Oligoflexia bacterium]|nr:hypothetical protein [Oligoflexia bacterium]MBF0365868.1 hypothetical protein [Oligoflexia bacterium]
MDKLLPVERIVLESLARGSKGTLEVTLDTSIPMAIAHNILQHFLLQGLVVFSTSEQKYSLCLSELTACAKNFNSKEGKKHEICDLFEALAMLGLQLIPKKKSSYGRPQLKMRKVWLNYEDEIQVNQLLYNLEMLVDRAVHSPKKNSTDSKISDQRLILWGHSHYGSLVKTTLKTI